MIIDIGAKLGKEIDIRWSKPFDNNQNHPNTWDSAKLRVLVLFFSDGSTRSVSNTYNSLDALCKKEDGQIFVDYCYFPHKEDVQAIQKAGVPFILGNVSNRTIDEYDLVLASFSIIQEVVNVFAHFRNSGVPVWHKDRIERGDYPLIVGGGITIDATEALNGNGGVLDLIAFGQGERTVPVLLKHYLNHKREEYKTPQFKKGFIKKFVTENSWAYYPPAYEHVYDETGKRIVRIEKLKEWAPDKVEIALFYDMDNHPFFEHKIFTPNGGNATGADILISSGCTNFGACSFCHEGQLQGPWRELSFDEMCKRLEESKKWGAPNSASAYSFNLNYYSRFMDLIHYMSKTFSSLSFINERMDVLAEKPEYLEVAKLLGANRLSAAIEGVGDRVRNHILNKNLPFETWYKAAGNVFAQRFAEMKNGMILTGVENDADFDDGIREFTEIVNLKHRMQVNTSLRQTFTPLVIYDQVPLRWEARRTAEMSFNQERTMSKWLDAMKVLDIRVKFNGGGLGTWFQQCIIDYGRKFTAFLHEYSKDPENFFYSDFVSPAKKDYVVSLMTHTSGVDPTSMLQQERDLDWIFPSNILRGSTDMIYRTWKALKKKGDFKLNLCVRTPVNLNPKCYNCGTCPTKEHIQFQTRRSLESEHKVEDVAVALYENKPEQVLRLVGFVAQSGEVFNKQAMSHYLVSEFLRRSPYLLSQYYSTKNYSARPLFENFQKDYMWGHILIDTFWKTRDKRVQDEIEGLTKEANADLQHVSLKKVVKLHSLNPSFQGSIAFYAFESEISKEKLINGWLGYKGKCKVAMKSMTFTYDDADLPKELVDLKVVAGPDNSSKGVIKLPWRYNPHMFLYTLSGTSYWKVLKVSNVSLLNMMGVEARDCACGRGKLRIGDLSGEMLPICEYCYVDRIMEKLAK